MIGVDVVDLSIGVAGYTKARRTRWLEKISEPIEWQGLHQWPQELWADMLWAMKESVFKCQSRKTCSPVLFPKGIKLIDLQKLSDTTAMAIIHSKSEKFIVKLRLCSEYVHAIAQYQSTMPVHKLVVWEKDFPSGKQGQLIRNSLESHLNSRSAYSWRIRKDANGLPVAESPVFSIVALSFSHHGRFGAWAYLPALLSVL